MNNNFVRKGDILYDSKHKFTMTQRMQVKKEINLLNQECI